MPANLTPQYLKAEEAYRRASTPEEELDCLQVMLRELPKHKGTDRLQADLKQKISRLKKEAATQSKVSGRSSTKIPRQGAGRVVLIGGPNAGKSQLIKGLTRAEPEVAPYPFTTREAAPAMMPYQDVLVQLIDTPPITTDFLDPGVQGLIRGADLVLLLVDVGRDDGIDAIQEVMERLQATKTRLDRESRLDEDDVGVSYTRTLVVLNKADDPQHSDRIAVLDEFCPLDLPRFIISAQTGEGLEALKHAVYESLDVVRIYTKHPSQKQADFEKPFTIKRGGTLLEVAELIHHDLVRTFKFARVWGSNVHDGAQVKGDYVVQDKDIVEIHA